MRNMDDLLQLFILEDRKMSRRRSRSLSRVNEYEYDRDANKWKMVDDLKSASSITPHNKIHDAYSDKENKPVEKKPVEAKYAKKTKRLDRIINKIKKNAEVDVNNNPKPSNAPKFSVEKKVRWLDESNKENIRPHTPPCRNAICGSFGISVRKGKVVNTKSKPSAQARHNARQKRIADVKENVPILWPAKSNDNEEKAKHEVAEYLVKLANGTVQKVRLSVAVDDDEPKKIPMPKKSTQKPKKSTEKDYDIAKPMEEIERLRRKREAAELRIKLEMVTDLDKRKRIITEHVEKIKAQQKKEEDDGKFRKDTDLDVTYHYGEDVRTLISYSTHAAALRFGPGTYNSHLKDEVKAVEWLKLAYEMILPKTGCASSSSTEYRRPSNSWYKAHEDFLLDTRIMDSIYSILMRYQEFAGRMIQLTKTVTTDVNRTKHKDLRRMVAFLEHREALVRHLFSWSVTRPEGEFNFSYYSPSISDEVEC